MEYKDIQKRIDAAGKLLDATSLTREKLDAIAKLLHGINPKLDTLLKSVNKEFRKLDMLTNGDVVELTLESLPEATEEHKKRKKLLLFFLSLWKDLKGEVGRIQKEVDHQGSDHSLKANATTAGKILTAMKGPLGIATILAAGWVYLQLTSVQIVIQNRGCDPINPVVHMPFPVAGIRLPAETIPSGGSGVATLPPLPITVDGTKRGSVGLTMLGLSMHFSLESSGIGLNLDGTNLLGTKTSISLGEKKTHELVISCR